MPLRNLLIAAGLLVVLSGLVFWSNKSKEADEKQGSADQPKLLSIQDLDLAQIDIKRKDGKSLTLKKANDKWQITAPETLPVDSDAISSMVTTIGSLNADKIIEKNNTDWAGFGLQTPLLEVTVTTKAGKATKLQLGDDMAVGGGVYARLDGGPQLYAVSSMGKSAFDKTAQDMRDKRLLLFDSDKLSRVELTAKGATVEFGKNQQSEWQIVKPKPYRADNFAVEELVRKIKDAKMDVTVSEEDAKKAGDSFATGTKVAVARVTDAAGSHEIEIRQKGEDYFAKGPAIAGPQKVAKELGEGLDKGIEDFRNKKLFEFGFNDPTKVEIKGTDGQWKAYQKKDTKWFAGSQEMDAISVQSVIDRLREMSATGFADAGFTTPVLELRVTAKDGKLVDHIQMSKGAADYFAVRLNEPSVYTVTAATVDDLLSAAGSIRPPAPPAPAKESPKK
jgi:hypothetical protein